MLEATIVLQLVMGEHLEALIIALLLAFNSILSLAQEGRSEKALELLKQRLAPSALALRDGAWTVLPAAEIVPGDIVKLSLGGIVPADTVLLEGAVLLDQSMLTGESAAVEASAGSKAFAGALVRRGEALAQVTATGARTFYGRAAGLVQIAHAESSEQKAVLGLVRNITVINGGILAAITGYAYALGLPAGSLIQLVLTAILASIPVALPATFTLAAALAAQVLARKGVLLTRLAAVHEAASVDTLCSDKTGTLTRNELDVAAAVPAADLDRKELLRLAAAASSEASGDPVDAAIRAAAVREDAVDGRYLRVSFTPFDPALKQARAVVETPDHRRFPAAKGAFDTIARERDTPSQLRLAAESLEEDGHRVLGVAVGDPPSGRVVGLLGLRDPPREDAGELITQLSQLGVRTVMVTGDAPRTARAIAAEVGLAGPVITGEAIGDDIRSQDIGVVAGVLPEQKFRLVRALQRQGHIVGMCGDGANDAPALRQAQFGVAVASATDIAKSAAAVVLTVSGLAGIVEAIREGRRVHQRVTTYALNAITKKIELVPLLALGLLITGQPVLTPLLMILLLVAGDFLTMALTADHVRGAPRPVGWDEREMTVAALLMGLVKLGFTTSVIGIGRHVFDLDIATLQTLAFVALVFGGQAVVYVVRERSWLWSSPPSTWLLLASAVDVGLAAALAGSGMLMKPLPVPGLMAVALAATAFALVLDILKVRLMRKLVRL
jgi:H+-transporting ATPase